MYTAAFDDLPSVNASADAEVWLILAKTNLLSWVDFSFDGLPIRPGLFRVVADCLPRGYLRVVCAPSLGLSNAEYDSGTDELWVGFTAAAKVSHQALVIHECVPGWTRWRQGRVGGHIGGGGPRRAGGVPADRASGPGLPTSSNAQRQAVWDQAWSLAGEVIAGRLLAAADCEAMRNAVRGHPE